MKQCSKLAGSAAVADQGAEPSVQQDDKIVGKLGYLKPVRW